MHVLSRTPHFQLAPMPVRCSVHSQGATLAKGSVPSQLMPARPRSPKLSSLCATAFASFFLCRQLLGVRRMRPQQPVGRTSMSRSCRACVRTGGRSTGAARPAISSAASSVCAAAMAGWQRRSWGFLSCAQQRALAPTVLSGTRRKADAARAPGRRCAER